MVDGCRSELVRVLSGGLQGSVLGRLLFLLYTSELFTILQNKFIGYTDHPTLKAVVQSPGVRVAVAESLIRDLGRVSEWCDLWGTKLNARTTKTVMVSRSRTMHPLSPPLTIGGTVLKVSDDLDILEETFDSKMTFEKHLRSVSRGRPGEYSMIDCSLGDAFGALAYQFWSTILQSGARLPIHTLIYWTV